MAAGLTSGHLQAHAVVQRAGGARAKLGGPQDQGGPLRALGRNAAGLQQMKTVLLPLERSGDAGCTYTGQSANAAEVYVQISSSELAPSPLQSEPAAQIVSRKDFINIINKII